MPEPTPPQTPWNPLDSLRAAYLSLEEKYYQFAEYLEAHHIPFAKVFLEPIETRGIPSFPIALALLFLLLLSVFWIGAGPLLSTQASVKITVLSDQGRLDGALVTMEGPGVNRTGTTEKGSVEFANLPKGKKVTVRVAKAGYRESEQFLVIGQKNSISFSLQTNDVSVAVLVQDFQKRPLPQATLDYSYVDASGRQVSKSASSDYEGRAILNAELGVQVDGTASLSGYESKPFSFTADEGLQKTVFLRLIPQDTTVPLPSDPSEKASLSVTTKDSTGDAVESHIEVRDPDTNSLLAESDTSFGTATFNSLTVGSTVKVSADADGFDRGYTTVTLSKAKSVTLTLKAASGNGIRSTIKIVDDKGKPLKAYAAFIEIGPGDGNYSVFKESSEVSELTTTLASGRYYYGVAYKNGFLPSKSLRFAAGETKTIALIPATVSNSANLTVSVKDEDGLKISDAVALGFYDSDGEWVPPFNLKVLSGSTRFVGLPKATLTVKASYKSLKGAQSVSLQTGSGEANLTLFYPRATLRVLPVDFQSGANLSNFNATVNFSGNFRNNSQLASCAPAAGAVYCDLDVRADKNSILSVVAPLYQRANVSLTANLLKVGNVSEQSVRLVSLTDTGIVYVSNDIRFYDSENNLVTQLTADRSYWAKFFVYFAEGASQGGVFLRFNSFAPYDEVAFIVNTSQETPFAINGSSVVRGNGNFSGNLSPSLCALDFNGGARYQLAFADFQYNFTGSREVAFAVKVRADVGNATNVSMNYRAYAVANGKHYRTPVDTLMGNQNETATRPWCTAATLTKNFPLIACGGFGQVCCTTRGAPDNACDFGYQCMPNGASAPNTCQFPTACGQSSRFCSDNTVCCLDGGSKSCKPSSGTGACTTLAQCDPVCDADNQFCDSSRSTGGGICSDVQCGGQGQVCCGGNECGSGLLCASGKCEACGGFGEACCPYADNPANACDDGLQCGNNKCGAATFCGSSENKCEGATVCCNDADPSKRGQCVANNECNAPVLCTSPVCGSDQYCDASLLSGPHCKLCDADHCPLGKPNGMCDPRAPKPCENAGYICTGGSSNSLGTCTPCGQDGQTCCSQGSGCDGSKGLSCQSDNICKACGGLNEMCCTGTAPGTTACDVPLQCADSASGQTCQSFPACGNSVCSPSNPLCCLDARTNAASCVANEAACNGVLSQCQPACTGFSFCNATQLPADCQLCSTLVGQSAQLDRLCPNYCNIYAAINCDSPVSGQNFYCPNDYNGGVCTMCGGEGQACCPSAPGRPGSVCETDNLFCSPTGVCAEKVACGSQVCTGAQLCCLTANGLGCAADSSACIGAPLQCPNNNCNNNPQAFCKISVGPPIEAACVDCASEPVGSQWFTAFCADHYCDATHATCDSQTESCDLNTHTCQPIGGECTPGTAGNAQCATTYGASFSCALHAGKYVCEECSSDGTCKSSHNNDNSYYCAERANPDGDLRGVCVQGPDCSPGTAGDAECKRVSGDSTYVCKVFTGSPGGYCAPPTATCAREENCASGQKCDNYACVAKTCSDITCGAGTSCNPASLQCDPCGADGQTCCPISPTQTACSGTGSTCQTTGTSSVCTPPPCGDFGETCCPTPSGSNGNGGNTGGSPLMTFLTKPGNGGIGTSSAGTSLGFGACKADMQCVSGTCTYPTECGNSGTFCSDNQKCCQSVSNADVKQCLDSCGTGFVEADCNLQCQKDRQYCDSTGSTGGVCTNMDCGELDQTCCGYRECNGLPGSLKCNLDSFTCVSCGAFDQQCCSGAGVGASDVCSNNFQCVPVQGRSNAVCAAGTVCGAVSGNICQDGSVCCNAPGKVGQCLTAAQCGTSSQISQCSACAINQYCDASNLANPVCALCTKDVCSGMGGIGQLCNPAESSPCNDVHAVCQVSSSTSPLGICQPCGSEGQVCCPQSDAAPLCTESGTLCDTSQGPSGQCVAGNRLCQNGNCISMSFSQLQGCTSANQSDTAGCHLENGDSGFEAKSLKNCDSERCDDRNLQIIYKLEPTRTSYPMRLRLQLFNSDNLRFLKVVNSLGVSVDIPANTVPLVVITDASWLSGKIVATPWVESGRIGINAFLRNSSNMSQFDNYSTFLKVVNGTPNRNPGALGALYSCNNLTLVTLRGPRGNYIQSSCDQVVFQVDGIFPADAIKASTQGLRTSDCNAQFEFYNDSVPFLLNNRLDPTCFDFGGPLPGKAFRYNPTANGCRLNSGTLSPTSGNYTMAIRCEVGGPILKNVSIQVRNTSIGNALPPVDVSVIGYKDSFANLHPEPRSYYYENDDNSTLRTVYVVDNRQIRPNSESFKVGEYRESGNKYQFFGPTVYSVGNNFPRASLFVWNTAARPEGSPSISIFENPSALVSRSPDARTPAFKTVSDSILGSLSQSVQTIAALQARGDDPHAPLDESKYIAAVLDQFKLKASQIAQRTAFRRAFASHVYCTTDNPSLSDLQNSEICRPALSDWQTLQVVPSQTREDCTFCDDQYAHKYNPQNQPITASISDACDSGCVESAECAAVNPANYCVFLNDFEDDGITPGRREVPLKVTCSPIQERLDAQGNHVDWHYDCTSAYAPQFPYSFTKVVSSQTVPAPKFVTYALPAGAQSALVPCDGPDNLGSQPYVNHDACQPDATCRICGPDGYRIVNQDPLYVYSWTNASVLYEITADGEEDPQAPYKYFDVSTSPFEFTMVLQATAHQLKNLLPNVPDAFSYSSNAASLIDDNPVCQVRQGLFLLRTKSTDGSIWEFDPSTQTIFDLDTLSLKTNYPRYQTSGDGAPEVCGSVQACNLFDPTRSYTLTGSECSKVAVTTYTCSDGTSYESQSACSAQCPDAQNQGSEECAASTTYISQCSPQKKIPESWFKVNNQPLAHACLTQEYPLVPDAWLDKISSDWVTSGELERGDSDHIQVGKNPLMNGVNMNVASLQNFIFNYYDYDKWGCFNGCNYRYRYYYLGPYDLSAYPNVFGEVRRENCKFINRPGACSISVSADGKSVDLTPN